MSLSSASSLSFRAIFLALIIPLLRLLFSIVSFFLKRFLTLAALLGTISLAFFLIYQEYPYLSQTEALLLFRLQSLKALLEISHI